MVSRQGAQRPTCQAEVRAEGDGHSSLRVATRVPTDERTERAGEQRGGGAGRPAEEAEEEPEQPCELHVAEAHLSGERDGEEKVEGAEDGHGEGGPDEGTSCVVGRRRNDEQAPADRVRREDHSIGDPARRHVEDADHRTDGSEEQVCGKGCRPSQAETQCDVGDGGEGCHGRHVGEGTPSWRGYERHDDLPLRSSPRLVAPSEPVSER